MTRVGVVMLMLTGTVLAGTDATRAQEAPAEAVSPINQARRLIAEGNAAEARTVLERFIADSPKHGDVDFARTLTDRIKSIEILFDLSHEWTGDTQWAARLLLANGYGVTRSHASVPSYRDRLADYELVVLWQETTQVPYLDEEYEALSEYVKNGGRLLIVTNAGMWKAWNPVLSPRRYPLWNFARRFGLKMKDPVEEITLDGGRVTHRAKDRLLSGESTHSENEADRRQSLAVFEALLPYPKLENSGRNDWSEPEIAYVHQRITFRYARTLEMPARKAIKMLPKAAGFCENLFGEPLDHDVVIIGVTRVHERLVDDDFELCMVQADDVILHHLTRLLLSAWMRPKDSNLRYPPWLEGPWMDMVVLEMMKKLGFPGRYGAFEGHHHGMFRRHDPRMDRINIANPGDVNHYAWLGKCEFLYQDLSRKQGMLLMRKFREYAFLYHRAGRISGMLTTQETIRLLSLAAGKNLFPYFRALGTRVEPLEVDFTEPERLRKEIAEKETEKTEAD